MEDNINLFERSFKKIMKNKDFDSFKKNYPTLLKAIEESMIKARIESLEDLICNYKKNDFIIEKIMKLKQKIK